MHSRRNSDEFAAQPIQTDCQLRLRRILADLSGSNPRSVAIPDRTTRDTQCVRANPSGKK
jgi:hypothetical protein